MSRPGWAVLGFVLIAAGSAMVGVAVAGPPAPPPAGDWADLSPDLDAPTPAAAAAENGA